MAVPPGVGAPDRKVAPRSSRRGDLPSGESSQIRNRRTTPAVHDPEGSSIATTENPSGSWEWCRWGGWFAMIVIGESEAGGAGGLAGYGEGGDRAGHAALAVREQQVPARCRLRDRDRAGEGACCGCSRVADDL